MTSNLDFNTNFQGLNLEASLKTLSEEFANSVSRVLPNLESEEDLRIFIEKLLEPICERLGIYLDPKYEKRVFSGGRIDAMHGNLIIEYERPLTFRSTKKLEETEQQLFNYLKSHFFETKENLLSGNRNFAGVAFDGERIFFLVPLQSKETLFEIRRLGPYMFDSSSARTFLSYLRSLKRKALLSENLAVSFGQKSKVTSDCISSFVSALAPEWDAEGRGNVFINEWKRLFGIVYGEAFETLQSKDIQGIPEIYGLKPDTDVHKLLFSLHTYYVLLIKLIAIEYLDVYESKLDTSYSSKIAHSRKGEIKQMFNFIEDGGVFNKHGITNFLEGDFFRWYLDTWWGGLEDSIRELTRELAQYEPTSLSLNPDSTRDLLKDIYHELMPKAIRHKLGEYYTPDWLAELIIDSAGYKGKTTDRFLDPSCGTGTFLVIAINRAKEYGKKNNEPKIETLKRILSRIWGFDLNPMAVIASRMNYLLALGDLLDANVPIELKVYLADSIVWPERFGQIELQPGGSEVFSVPTSTDTFHIPKVWIKENWLLGRAASTIESLVSQRVPVDEAMNIIHKEGLSWKTIDKEVRQFYEEILNLEMKGMNGIWARFLKNLSAPMVAGKFDYVIGNPPWIRWDYLSRDYRAVTLPLWKEFGLFSLKGFESKLGGGKKDFSMLFTYGAAKYYLSKNGTLAFLIIQEVFKTKGAGEGFRRFQIGDKGQYLQVTEAHDFSAIQPFEDATNKTAAIVLKIGKKTTYPLPYNIWKHKHNKSRIPQDLKYEDVKYVLKKDKLFALPIDHPTSSWQTMPDDKKHLQNLKGKCAYTAVLGANPNPYGVFWLEVKQLLHNQLILVRNLPEKGKLKDIESVEVSIEPDLVYPALRGADIKRWKATPQIYMLVTQNPETRRGYPIEQVRYTWPRTLGYLLRFKEILANRPLYKKFYHITFP